MVKLFSNLLDNRQDEAYGDMTNLTEEEIYILLAKWKNLNKLLQRLLMNSFFCVSCLCFSINLPLRRTLPLKVTVFSKENRYCEERAVPFMCLRGAE